MTDEEDRAGRKERYKRPSDRMFRRSRAAEMRRHKSLQADARFLKVITGLTSAATLIVFAIIIYYFKGTANAAEAPSSDTAETQAAAPTTALTEPLFGNFTGLDLLGIAFVMVAGYAVWRKYQNKD